MNFEEAQDLTAMLLMQSVAARAKAVFRMQPSISVDRVSWTGDAEYQVDIALPPGKYIYAVDIEQFRAMAMQFEGAKSNTDGTLHIYWSIKLNHFIALQNPKERNMVGPGPRPQNKAGSGDRPQKTEPSSKTKPGTRTLF